MFQEQTLQPVLSRYWAREFTCDSALFRPTCAHGDWLRVMPPVRLSILTSFNTKVNSRLTH